MKIIFQKCLSFGLSAAMALFFVCSSMPAKAIAVAVNIGVAPPPLPVYAQPACPADSYIWTPGYWAWDPNFNDFYWVPGTWVLAPEVGLLWTPAWWGWSDGGYCFHPGYWGRHVGFYGGIDYGYGYNGHGYGGGYWHRGHFFYNRSVTNVANTHIRNVYSRSVTDNRDRVSFNGGRGGVTANPTTAELRADNEHHFAATSAQVRHARTASSDPGSRFSGNHGQPAVTTTARAGALHASAGTQATSANHFSSEFRPATHTASANTNGHVARTNVEGNTRVTHVNHHFTSDGGTFHATSHTMASAPHFNSYHAPAMTSHAPSFHTSAFHAQASHAQAHASVSHGGGGGGSHHR
ncbi:MAG: YXWGXW repeat-containing protein [Methylacidiphilales bacterium]|nr:YXWGXW repeat-containing protein [Candidatus Methylacidiphilales bacterium]